MGEPIAAGGVVRQARSAPRGALLAGALWLAACSSGSDPGALAEKITRAVYANDLDSTVASFDDQTKKVVTRSQLGVISDRMHALGDIKSFAQRSAEPDKGRYDYDVSFSNGIMLVQLRVDPDGKVGAYRVVPETAASPAASRSAD
ncbi:MAG: hypothetical protein ACLPYS_17150 [Vulcanimicrobiaceae bacterium]